MRFCALILFLNFVLNVHAQGLKVRGKTIVDKEGNEILLRGIGLGGWMLQEPYMMQLSGIASTQHDIKKKINDVIGTDKTEVFYAAWLKNHCTKTDIDSLAAWGFNSVRLPIHYNLFTLPVEEEPTPGNNTWIEKGFAMTDSLLSWCKANKIYLILDLHAAPGGQGNDIAIADRDTTKAYLWEDDRNRQKTISLWEKLASRYANEEWMGGYDLINEPNYGFETKDDKNGCAENLNLPLRDLMIDITKAIRKVDKKHIIFIEGNCWGNNYKGIFPLWDDNIVISFHKYWNYTDQGSIQHFLDMREKYNAPVWCGETGENSNLWFTDAIELFEKNKIGWAMWPMKKMGINNPLQVKTNVSYQELIKYWKGEGEKPLPNDAYIGLMQLTEDIRATNTIYRKDVIDAMMRQVKTSTVIPFKKHNLQKSAIVFAADYDMGRNGVAYYDKDTGNYWVSTQTRTDWNKGRVYRNDGVDISTCDDSISNGYSVGWIEDGEWLQYTINNEKQVKYDIHIRYLHAADDGALNLLVNGQPISKVALNNKPKERSWQTALAGKNIVLQKGISTIRVIATKGGFNLNYLHFISSK